MHKMIGPKTSFARIVFRHEDGREEVVSIAERATVFQVEVESTEITVDYDNIRDNVGWAMEHAKGTIPSWMWVSPVARQMSQALRLYRERGEYDGTRVSALECLDRAGYEL